MKEGTVASGSVACAAVPPIAFAHQRRYARAVIEPATTDGAQQGNGEWGMEDRQAPGDGSLAHSFLHTPLASRWSGGHMPPDAPVSVHKGADPSLAVIIFKGFGGSGRNDVDVIAPTGLSAYSRIVLQDVSNCCYLAGLPPVASDCDGILAIVRDNLRALAPQRVLMMGISAGSHAALLYGHLLGADYVHAFAPYTNLHPDFIEGYRNGMGVEPVTDVVARLRGAPASSHRYFDLREVLANWNGKTLYNVHACKRSELEMFRAQRIAGLPGVTVHPHPCGTHAIVTWLARHSRLQPLLAPGNQTRVADVFVQEGVHPERARPAGADRA
ncbi:MAG: hypothetical protein ABI190_00395 [Casimicrobiaceae bacterium]